MNNSGEDNNINPQHWAEKFCRTARAEKARIDEVYMASWFANYAAVCSRVYGEKAAQLAKQVGELKSQMPTPKHQSLQPKNAEMG